MHKTFFEEILIDDIHRFIDNKTSIFRGIKINDIFRHMWE